MHTTQTLYNELSNTLRDIDTQIKHIKNDIANGYPEEKRDKLAVWFWMRYSDGTYVLERMLQARASTLNAMAALKAADLNAKAASVKGKR